MKKRVLMNELDGIDHINIYSKGKTSLGKWLSNFSFSPIFLLDGDFHSIEGYWYWLNCDHPDRDKLKNLTGFKAKSLGRKLTDKDWNNDLEFKLKILHAITQKIYLDEQLLNLFKNNKLPFKHYYVYGDKIVEPKEGKWLVDFFNFLRTII